jgi:hypothetical protein
MNPMGYGFSFNDPMPSIGVYPSSTMPSPDSSMGSGAISQTPSTANFGTGYSFNHTPVPDVITDADHVDTMPESDVFFTEQGDYVAGDAF